MSSLSGSNPDSGGTHPGGSNPGGIQFERRPSAAESEDTKQHVVESVPASEEGGASKGEGREKAVLTVDTAVVVGEAARK